MYFTEREYALAKTIAYKMASKWKLMDRDELHARLNYWLVVKHNTVERYRTEEGGEGKLYVALNREAAKQCQHETELITGEPMHMKENQSYTYDYQTVYNALTHYWVWDSATLTNSDASNMIQDIMIDIQRAYNTLNAADQIILEYKFKEDKTYAEIGEILSISKQAARMRIVNLVERIKKIIG
jgi:DNA-directed RNA polymerase specialized sigma subunit